MIHFPTKSCSILHMFQKTKQLTPSHAGFVSMPSLRPTLANTCTPAIRTGNQKKETRQTRKLGKEVQIRDATRPKIPVSYKIFYIILYLYASMYVYI